MKTQCLCGAVVITAPEVKEVDVCHCGICRRWGGGPLLALHCGLQVIFEGRQNIKIYASSDWAERAFCTECGTHLYFRLKATGDYYLPAGLFTQIPGAKLRSQIFIDRKPDYYRFANTTEELTEAEVFAKYAPGAETSDKR